VNPVTWWTLAHAGVAVRGDPARALPRHVDEAAFVTHVTGLAGTPIPDEERG